MAAKVKSKKGAASAAPITDYKTLTTGSHFKDANGVLYRIGARDFWNGGYRLWLVKGSRPSSDTCLVYTWRPGRDKTKSRPKPWFLVDQHELAQFRSNYKKEQERLKAEAEEKKRQAALEKQRKAQAKIDKRVRLVMDLIADMS